MNIAPKPCPFCGETRTRLMTTNTAATKAVDLLDRMAGFLDGMYRRPPPIVEKLLAEYEEIRATPPAEPASAADGAKPIIPNWFPDDRCQVCGWPLAPSRDQGCVAGDCSFRPQEGTDSYRITQLRRKALAERADPAQSADTPVIATDNDDTPSEAVALLREAIEALEGWDDDPVDGDTWIARAERYIESASRPQPARGEVSEAEVKEAARAIAKRRFGVNVAWPENNEEARVALEAAARVRGGDARQMIAWQSMETAPKDGTRILLGCAKHHSVICGFWDANLGGWRSPCGEEADHLCASDPTAWTYLPEPTQ
jgi:hypothetical protein